MELAYPSITLFFIYQNPVQDVVAILWMLFQPLLFGLIGAEVEVSSLSGDIIGEIFFFFVLDIISILNKNMDNFRYIFIDLFIKLKHMQLNKAKQNQLVYKKIPLTKYLKGKWNY